MATVSTTRIAVDQCFVVDGVSWQSYQRITRAFADRPVRITYDRGVLELMTLSPEHECYKKILARLIEALTEELSLPLASFGSMTFKKRRRQRGLEPDECYWIASEPRIRGKIHIDLRVDPPPDLVVEIDVTSPSINRMGIYAVLGVPEVWRLDGTNLDFLVLDQNKQYQAVSTSKSFPNLTPDQLHPFLAERTRMDENAVIRRFRAWVRQNLVPPPP